MRQNWNKIMNFLVNVSKMRTTYLCDKEQIVEMRPESCWGLLNDIMDWKQGCSTSSLKLKKPITKNK